jgi:ankyrin repeat protein
LVPGLAGCTYASLLEAAKAGDLAAVKTFEENDNGDMYQVDSTGNTPLTCAILNGHNTVALYLLDQGFPVNGWPEHSFTPLMACASRYTWQSTEMLRILLERGANPNQRYDKEGWLPLGMVVNNDMPDKVKLLVQYGADFNLRDRSGVNPLELAEARLAAARDLNNPGPEGSFTEPWTRATEIRRWEKMVALLKRLIEGRGPPLSGGHP